MRLSQHSDYAFRMLIHAALRAPELTTAGEVASDFGLSLAHLQKVAQTLAAHGYLQTVRGRSGGLRLARAPERIRLGRVAAVTEPDFQIAPCMSPSEENCPIYEPCALRTALSQAAEAFLAELDKWTLADLLKKRKPLLLAIEGQPARRVV
ncbi:MAG TPA: Rrf2 family transcriptional regulator [Bryobacteraceae bacterium]|nr:Rrf2 family transcriptional regulator [Bryobacteraceae bacterium]